MLTIKPHGKNGRLDVVDDKGRIVGFGRMRPSKTVPGYCTITTDQPLSRVFRVPINWIEALHEQTN